MFRIAIVLLAITACSSCMSKYVFTLTDKQVRERYAGKSTAPNFGFISSNGLPIYYAVQGDSTKPLLVLVHGAPGRWYSSINLLDDSLLLSRYRILAYDRPGYGKSATANPVTSITEQAEHLATLIEQFNTTGMPVVLAGRSYGTPIAARYAMLYPEQVQKLVLLGSCIDPAKEKYFWFSYANLSAAIQSV
ncbi:MAG: alpha/beta hydrolase, partial [Dinghuibacter sp.]|nr:alpha/beta hydrolase [Dinghuibacter sp.]